MKHLKKFENFGRFEHEEKDNELENDFENNEFDDFNNGVDTDEVCDVCGMSDCECEYCDDDEDEDDIKRWGDEEIVEKKKVNAGFQAYLDKQKEKNSKKDKKEDKEDKKDDKKAPKGLSAAQKKLPEAMQKAILKRMK